MEKKYEFDENGNVNNIIKTTRKNKLFLLLVFIIILFQIVIIIFVKNKDYNGNYYNLLNESSSNISNNILNETNKDNNSNENSSEINKNITNTNQVEDNSKNHIINDTNIDKNYTINNTNIDNTINDSDIINNNSINYIPIQNNNTRIKNIHLIQNTISQSDLPKEFFHEPITNITISTNHTDPTLILKIAFISDSHIDPDNPKKHPFEKNLYNSLINIKLQNVDIIIFGGDLCDVCSENAFNKFLNIYKSVFPENESNPILLLTMGNHDYYPSKEKNYTNYEAQDLFEKIFKVKHQNHTIINNYHFILWGNQHIDYDFANSNIRWFDEEMQYILNNQNTIFNNSIINPIFIITHFPPRDTSFRSEFWGSFDLFNTFIKYSNIINLCAHSHATLMDENSINQKLFTVINSQAISRVTVDFAENNYDVPTDEFGSDELSYKNYMGDIIEVRKDYINVKRIYLDDGSFYDKEWNLVLPLNEKNFIYNDSRIKNVKQPYFEIDENESESYIKIIKTVINGTERFQMRFKQAIHDNFVYGYNISFIKKNFLGKNNVTNQEILKNKYDIYDGYQGPIKESFVYKNGNNEYIEIRNFTYFYISDFFLKPKDRKKYITLLINEELEKGEYNVVIKAMASYKILSKNNITERIVLE